MRQHETGAQPARKGVNRALIIGERYNMSRDMTLDGIAQMTPARWAGVSKELGAWHDGVGREKLMLIGLPLNVEHFKVTCMNLLPPAPQDVEWNATLAKRIAEIVVTWSNDYDVMFLVGRRVATAFGLKWPFLHSGLLPSSDVAGSHALQVMLVPHPSGLNPFWNDDVEVGVAKEMVSEFLTTCAARIDDRKTST